jgi:hypothetical protein
MDIQTLNAQVESLSSFDIALNYAKDNSLECYGMWYDGLITEEEVVLMSQYHLINSSKVD